VGGCEAILVPGPIGTPPARLTYNMVRKQEMCQAQAAGKEEGMGEAPDSKGRTEVPRGLDSCELHPPIPPSVDGPRGRNTREVREHRVGPQFCREQVRGFRTAGFHRTLAHVACPGPRPIRVIDWKHELPIVPFTGEWAAGACLHRVQKTGSGTRVYYKAGHRAART